MSLESQDYNIDISEDITVRDARIMMMDAGVKLKDVANEMGYSCTHLSRILSRDNLNKKLSLRHHILILNAIKQINRKRNNEV